MADKTKISWADATWNMLRARNLKTSKQGWHCEHVTEACRNCYAERLNIKPGATGGTGLSYKPGMRKYLDIFLSEKALTQPLRWQRGRRIFPCSMTDMFGEWVTDAQLDRIFAVMGLASQHTFEVLTKRPARMRRYLSDPETPKRIWAVMLGEFAGRIRKGATIPAQFPFPNIWVGTSICDQANAEDFVPELLGTPAALRFVSAAPLLGDIDLTYMRHAGDLGEGEPWLNALGGYTFDSQGGSTPVPRIGWVLTEGESGKHARPTHPDWFRRLRDDCAAAAVPFHHKQNGEFIGPAAYRDRGHMLALKDLERVGLKKAGRELDGVLHNEFPA